MIEGKVIDIVALSSVHNEFMLSLLNNQEIAYLEGRTEPLISLEKQKIWFEKNINSTNQYFIIQTKSDVIPIGYMSLKMQNNVSANAQVAIKLMPDAQGKGYGVDAIKTITKLCFITYNLHRLHTHIVSYNIPSQKLFISKCGWRQEGIEIKSVFVNGEYHDNILIALLKEEFLLNEKDAFYNPLVNGNE